ncbi:hypothetical protein VNO80_06101 [Phaseolus coccineus]|uniref:Uncharacterized protein n=1 Tax=Phaseolus coccineus TaxID=3886 RepID=A0AAN9NLH7_PHACN
MISNAGPKVKLGCSDMTKSLCENLEEVKFVKKESMDAEEENNVTAFVKMKTTNQALFLSPGTVRAAANATVATSVATTIPESAIPVAASLISLDNCLCSL